MRNLKKFLALVLALVMAMSLMVTASASVTTNATDDYPDWNETVAESKFQVSIDVLSGMGIFRGENGAFKPTDKIMRCEVVAMMYRLCTGDVNDSQMKLYAPDAYVFGDVPQGVWYDGYLGYCVSRGIIKGYNGNFNPTGYVTGYEMLIMLLRAVGYGKNGEYTGADFRINSAADAQKLGILDEINSTHYANMLSMDSPREVVAQMTFKAINLPQVRYELGMYNPWIGVPITGGNNLVRNQTLAEEIFGLTSTSRVVIGNQDTGENATVLGSEGSSARAYAWEGTWDPANDGHGAGNTADDITITSADIKRFSDLVTGIGELGHRITVWYGKTGVYAWYDKSAMVETVTVEDSTSLELDPTDNTGNSLGAYAKKAGFDLTKFANTAVFNDYFGRSGLTTDTDADSLGGDGQRTSGVTADSGLAKSPINMYLLISNDDGGIGSKTLDVVIPLNIETSQITESTVTRGVPTVAMPVDNSPSNGTSVKYVDTDNVTSVSGVDTGVIAQDALTNKLDEKGNIDETKTAHVSTTNLWDYEVGIHINGTTPRDPSDTEKVAVKYTNTNATATETGYFLLYHVLPKETGTVVTFNAVNGTVVLDNGTVLTRSKYYDTVVGTGTANPALPQSQDAYNNESYNLANYVFYMDWDGNYLGAERTYTNEFFYGTYLDYEQKLSTSTFTYYLTGVTLDGKVETKVVTNVYSWNQTQGSRVINAITSTDALKVPFHDAFADDGNMNGLNTSDGYKGYTITGTTLDPNVEAGTINTTDYVNNMERLSVIRGLGQGSTFDATDSGSDTMDENIVIDSTALALGMVKVKAGSDLYINDNTRIILVDGYGTDSLKPEVYSGLNDMMKGLGASSATIYLDPTTSVNGSYLGVWDHDDSSSTPYAAMTYYQKSPYTFDQIGNTAEKVDVIILPKAAVKTPTAAGTDIGTYFMGDPTYVLIGSHSGNPVYLYNLYDTENGDAHQIWLNVAPTDVHPDTFVEIESIGKLEQTGDTIYKATWLDTDGLYANYNGSPSSGLIDGQNDQASISLVGGPTSTVTFTSVGNGSSLTGTFSWSSGDSKLMSVANAKVVNLNSETSPDISATKGSGYVWQGITNLTSFCNAGSIQAVTSTPLRVAAVASGVNVSLIFVCWDQR